MDPLGLPGRAGIGARLTTVDRDVVVVERDVSSEPAAFDRLQLDLIAGSRVRMDAALGGGSPHTYLVQADIPGSFFPMLWSWTRGAST
jgi:hypothetical protein